MDSWGLKWCYFLCLSAAATTEWCYILCLSADDTKSINAYQNDVTFYDYQPPPPPNDVHIDAYQPDDIAINSYQVCKKLKSVFIRTTSWPGCGLSGWSFHSCQKQTPFLLDLSVLDVRTEIHLSTRSLDSVPAIGHCTTCFICNCTYHKDFLPVFRSGVISFLEWLTATTKLPFIIDFKVNISSLLKQAIFGMRYKPSKSVSWTNVDALFLSLAASGIIKTQNTNDGIKWFVGCQAPLLPQTKINVTLMDARIGEAKYKLDEYWVGIHQHPPTRIRVCTPQIPTPQ